MINIVQAEHKPTQCAIGLSPSNRIIQVAMAFAAL